MWMVNYKLVPKPLGPELEKLPVNNWVMILRIEPRRLNA
jgi:hypothetical protein